MTETPSALDTSRQAYQDLLIEILKNPQGKDEDEKLKCQVISVEAEWGYGKTRLLERVGKSVNTEKNFQERLKLLIKLLKLLKRPSKTVRQRINFIKRLINRKQYLWVEFNPWQYEDPKHLLTLYFNELRTKLCRKFLGIELSWECRWRFIVIALPLALIVLSMYLYGNNIDYRYIITLYLSVFSFAFLLKFIGLFIKSIPTLLKIYDKINQGEERKSLHEQRTKINKALKKFKYKRIFVVIEDLDRLPPKEVYDIIQMVRMVADFHKITYILAFDKDHVVDALDQFFPTKKPAKDGITTGDEYLRRIINRRTAMPFLPNEALKEYLEQEITKIVEPDPKVQDFWNTALNIISEFIRTPRQANMIADKVSLLHSSLSSINPHPLHLLICGYFIEFQKELWQEVFNRRTELTKNKDDANWEICKQIIHKISSPVESLKTIEDDKKLLDLLSKLFLIYAPKYASFRNLKTLKAFFDFTKGDHDDHNFWFQWKQNYLKENPYEIQGYIELMAGDPETYNNLKNLFKDCYEEYKNLTHPNKIGSFQQIFCRHFCWFFFYFSREALQDSETKDSPLDIFNHYYTSLDKKNKTKFLNIIQREISNTPPNMPFDNLGFALFLEDKEPELNHLLSKYSADENLRLLRKITYHKFGISNYMNIDLIKPAFLKSKFSIFFCNSFSNALPEDWVHRAEFFKLFLTPTKKIDAALIAPYKPLVKAIIDECINHPSMPEDERTALKIYKQDHLTQP